MTFLACADRFAALFPGCIYGRYVRIQVLVLIGGLLHAGPEMALIYHFTQRYFWMGASQKSSLPTPLSFSE